MDRGPSIRSRRASTSICLEARKRMERLRLCLAMGLDAPGAQRINIFLSHLIDRCLTDIYVYSDLRAEANRRPLADSSFAALHAKGPFRPCTPSGLPHTRSMVARAPPYLSQ